MFTHDLNPKKLLTSDSVKSAVKVSFINKRIMKNLFTKLFIAFITTISIAAAQAQSSTKSLLWKVSGNGLSKPSYLYGTIHMICAPDYFLSNQAKTAFDQTDQLTLEINMSDPQEM